MFRLYSSVSAFLLLLCVGLWIFYLSVIKQGSLSEEQRTRFKASLEDSSLSSAKQTRTKIQKDIWISQKDHTRLHNRLESQSSFLTLNPKKGSIEVIEHLYDVACWSQEKFFTEGNNEHHQMRALTAKEGTYRYQNQTFNAFNASLSLYKIPGNTLITTAKPHQSFLQGTAEEISLGIEKGIPTFQALDFKASLSSGGHL